MLLVWEFVTQIEERQDFLFLAGHICNLAEKFCDCAFPLAPHATNFFELGLQFVGILRFDRAAATTGRLSSARRGD